MNIQVKIKTNYGTEMIYPVCEKAVLLCALTGKKTFVARDIKNIKALGYAIEVLHERVEL